MQHSNKQRRGFLARLTALFAALFAGSRVTAASSPLTPSSTEGPFYPTPSMRYADVDNDLVKVAGRVQESGGEIMVLSGQVQNAHGEALAGHLVEIWQCDLNGKYMHTGDRQRIEHDPDFQGIGHDITDASGTYRFRTIKPAKYTGRAPHIHVKVLDANMRELLTTQFYIAGDPANAADGIFRRLTAAQAEAVSMSFRAGQESPETTINIVV